MQSPLRNEVRYSPATRSSMRSFGSFGRQSTNSKGIRPSTPANDLSMPHVDAVSTKSTSDTTKDKLKGFGKRRRPSVGNILTGIQGGLQGLQEKIQQPLSAQSKEKKGQKKRSFSIGVGYTLIIPDYPVTEKLQNLFNLQGSTSPDRGENGRRASKSTEDTKPSQTFLPNTLDRVSASRQEESFFGDPFAKPQSNGPVTELTRSPRQSTEEPKPRTSTQLPLSPSANSALLSGRFYSQYQSGESPLSPLSPQHSRARSMPMTMPGYTLSQVAPSESDSSDWSKSQPRESNHEKEDKHAESQATPLFGRQLEQKDTTNSEHQPPEALPASPDPEYQNPQVEHTWDRSSPEPSTGPDQTVQSRKPVEPYLKPTDRVQQKNIAVSGVSVVSEHPFRDESLSVHRQSTPVELAAWSDDSSEKSSCRLLPIPGRSGRRRTFISVTLASSDHDDTHILISLCPRICVFALL
ncbi:hypothetical protein N7468_009160 [Penicillium chermesinum]|uniref:Uncharacterized protein n=1 Tax=Penicillium chermesinum TaxID=63820 RepID=A0A9W9NHK0_9EURO|nr:uncharacterized protein N7468_009160 [Penicillium chermesinum]KAJ5219956.1 hypothetical protein N7468_009160 [Penicillium chermesinum]